MAENKNQSIASWPSVTGSRTTGLDLRGLNPQLQRNAKILEAYQKRYASDVSAVKQMGDATTRLTKITQDINAKNFARQDQLLTARQGNFQRMNEMYGNYFQQFGNVLNESALKFLDEHSNIGVPTLTAIMAGYEHAKASRAQQELAMLDRQAKMAEAAYALDKQRADLEALKDQNAALSQQTALENQIKAIDAINKSQNQYYSDVARVYGAGVAGGRGTGVAGAGGLGSGSAAGSFQAPVTDGAGGAATATSAVADGGATGVFNPNIPEFLAAQKQIADSKAAQTAGQASQLGPLATQARTDSELITQWSDITDPVIGVAAISGIPVPFTKNTVGGLLGNSLVKAGSTTARGYFDQSTLTNAQTNLTRAQNRVATANRVSGFDRFRNAQNAYRQYLTNLDPTLTGRAREDAIRNMTNAVKNGSTAADLGISNREYNLIRNINDTERIYASKQSIRQSALDNLKNRQDAVKNLLTEQRAANSVGRGSKIIGGLQRGAGKFLKGGVVGKVALAGELLAHFGDDLGGAVSAAGGWAYDRYRDLTGQTTLEEAQARGTALEAARRRYYEGRDDTRAFGNALYNQTVGRVLGPSTIGIQNDDVAQVVDRLHELGWRDPEIINNNVNGLLEEQRTNPTAFRQAMEALYQYDPHLDPTTGRMGQEININPLEFFNRVYSNSVYRKQAFIQENKVAQNQQLTNQQAVEEAEKANMIDPRTHRFLAAMMKHYTDMGRQAGYDFHEGHAIQFANAYMQFVADMESGNKQGAVGNMTSTGTAKSRYQFMDKTFQSAVQWMLDEDERAGNQLLNSNEREILREARTKDANFLDNNGYGNLLGFMTLLYPLKSSVSASKFGSGNPDITGQQMVVDMIQQFKNGRGMTPYLLSNMGAAYSGALHGRMGKKEYANNQNRVTALIQSMYGPDHVATGVYMPDAQIGEFLGNQGIQWDMRYDPVVWRNQWVAENFDKNEKGDDLVPKSTYKPYEQWKIDNDLNQVRQVGKPEQITMSQYIKRLNDKVDFDNLDPLVKRQLNAMAEEVGKYGRTVQLNSGRRDPVKNDELIRRWESGDREGMVHKPSKNSKHLTGVAFDMQRSGANGLDDIVNNTPELKQKYGDARGMMAAYGFDNNVKNDPVHFSLNEDFRKNNSRSSGWTLPSVASLPFAPVEYPEVVVEPANQGIVDPLDLSAFDGMMPGGVNFSPTNYGVAMEQMQQQYPQEGYIDESMIVW